MNMTTREKWAANWITGAGCTFLATIAAHAADVARFDNRTLHDTYGGLGQAVLAGLRAATTDAFIFDGNGNCEHPPAKIYFESPGVPISVTSSDCHYAVNADGSGTLAITAPGFGTVHYSLMIVDNGKEVYLVGADEDGILAYSVLKKQRP
jgi:hypothetical protein